MKKKLKKPLWVTVVTTLCLVAVTLFTTTGCDKSDILPKTDNNVSFTPCQQNKLRSSELSDKVDVEFTGKGVQITHYDFEVPCDFTTVDVTHTLVNGVLNITQQGFPSKADCVCYTDVSYTLDGISQDEVNVIFVNGVQVYCHNGNYPIEISFTDYSLAETSCQWRNFESNKVTMINSNEELQDYIACADDDYSKIDFSKHSLLLVRGGATSGISDIDIKFFKEEASEYTLNVSIYTNMTAVAPSWFISILVPKISENAIVELIVKKNEGSESYLTFKDKLVGKWIEISPCESCHVFTFSQNDTVYQKFKFDNAIYCSHYNVTSEDSIQVVRDWEIEQDKKTTRHNVIFLSNDMIIIEQFMPVDYGITGFNDIKLIKTE